MRTWKVFGIAAIVILALGAIGVGSVFAMSSPSGWGPFGQGMGWVTGHMRGTGMMNGSSGMMNGGMMRSQGGSGMMDGIDMVAMHDLMMAPGGMHDQVLLDVAKALGLTSDQLTAELKNNKSLAQIAQEKGITTQQLSSVLKTAVETALKKAVAEKTLTQAQADAMLQHMNGNYEEMLGYMGLGMGSGTGGCHGNGSNNTAPTSTSF